MTVELLRGVLGWCAVINYAALLLWFALFAGRHDWLQRLHGRWFAVSATRFDEINYIGMAVFKLCILLFNLTPYLALRILA